MWDKKALELSASMLTKLILVLLGGIILFAIVAILVSDRSDIETQIQVCRSSVEAREFAARHSVGVSRSGVPMLCQTIDITVPEDKYNELAKEDYNKAVMMNIADRAMDCWYMFGQGKYDRNVFSGWGVFSKNQCFACFTFTIKDHKDFVPFKDEDFYKFLAEEPYKPIPRHVPFCLFDDEEEEGCVSSDAPECIRKGGNCLDSKTENFSGFQKYEGWDCDSNKKSCFIYENMVESYLSYMYSEAEGLFGIDPSFSDKTFTNEDILGVGFISHTRDIGYTVFAASLTTAGVALSIITGGSFGFIVLGALATTGGGVASDVAMNYLARQPPTIYFSTLSGLEQRCNVVDDFNQ